MVRICLPKQETQVQSLSGLGKSPGEGNGNPLQYSCLENPMDRGAWRAKSSWGFEESDMTSTHTHVPVTADLQFSCVTAFFSHSTEENKNHD